MSHFYSAVQEQIMEVLRACAEEKSWRVRYMMVRNLEGISKDPMSRSQFFNEWHADVPGKKASCSFVVELHRSWYDFVVCCAERRRLVPKLYLHTDRSDGIFLQTSDEVSSTWGVFRSVVKSLVYVDRFFWQTQYLDRRQDYIFILKYALFHSWLRVYTPQTFLPLSKVARSWGGQRQSLVWCLQGRGPFIEMMVGDKLDTFPLEVDNGLWLH